MRSARLEEMRVCRAAVIVVGRSFMLALLRFVAYCTERQFDLRMVDKRRDSNCQNSDNVYGLNVMVNPRDLDVRAFLKPTVLGQLGPEVLDQVTRCAVIERFEVPTLLNAAGTSLERLRLVAEGSISIFARKPSGKEVVISEVGPRGWAAWLPCFVAAPPTHDFYSGAKSCFIALPVKVVQSLCLQYPELYPLIIGEIGLRFRLLMEWASQSILLAPEQRMAKLIVLLAQEQKAVSSPSSIVITQSRLANLARCSRQSANVLLSNLEQKGLIQLLYGKCDIPDLAALAAFADAEEADAEPEEKLRFNTRE